MFSVNYFIYVVKQNIALLNTLYLHFHYVRLASEVSLYSNLQCVWLGSSGLSRLVFGKFYNSKMIIDIVCNILGDLAYLGDTVLDRSTVPEHNRLASM